MSSTCSSPVERHAAAALRLPLSRTRALAAGLSLVGVVGVVASAYSGRGPQVAPELRTATVVAPRSFDAADRALVDLVGVATTHWAICGGGRLDTAGPLVNAARTVAARRLDPDDPAVERAYQAAIDTALVDASCQGPRTWCPAAGRALARQLP